MNTKVGLFLTVDFMFHYDPDEINTRCPVKRIDYLTIEDKKNFDIYEKTFILFPKFFFIDITDNTKPKLLSIYNSETNYEYWCEIKRKNISNRKIIHVLRSGNMMYVDDKISIPNYVLSYEILIDITDNDNIKILVNNGFSENNIEDCYWKTIN